MRTIKKLDVNGKQYTYYDINEIEGATILPFSLKVLLENVLRNAANDAEAKRMADAIVASAKKKEAGDEVEFSPARVLFQDFTGVPVFVDFAAMREACIDLGADPERINPQIPCDLVIDHSVIADVSGCPESLEDNKQLEYERNSERYEFLKWAQASFDNVRIVPPGQGICHQLNIEQFADIVAVRKNADGEDVAIFDTVVGTDSHTPTVNGIGVLGWGVGGIEAEAAALGQPITTLSPRVIGLHLTGKLSDGVMAMDVALYIAKTLREIGVVGAFVECFGEGVSKLSAQQRACISNMTPEYGSTCTLFPIDDRTLEFMRLTGRSEQSVALIESYAKAQGTWLDSNRAVVDVDAGIADGRQYSQIIQIDLSDIPESLAGPSRPHDRIDFVDASRAFERICKDRGLDGTNSADVDILGNMYHLKDGAIAIAAVTSCTTATDPKMMLECGLIARNAANAGLDSAPWVKTILAPGSHATEMLLERAGLLKGLQSLGFYTCGFGCMSCIGNSGPLSDAMHVAADKVELASVLSGNRNFEGRISPDVAQNYLMTPAHVIAYAIAGRMDFDFENESLGQDANGNDVYLRDIEADPAELEELLSQCMSPDLYTSGVRSMQEGDVIWQSLSAERRRTFDWDDDSTYVRLAPYFEGMGAAPEDVEPIEDAVVLAMLGDFITTDHISPAGAISTDMPAAKYLQETGVSIEDFNTYGSRRGNHEVLMRGTFGNVKLSNKLAEDGKLGGYTTDMLEGKPSTIYEAARNYIENDTPAIVIAGKMYGSGSSRDWAAKGPMLLGVKAVIAESFERIHRSNLIGMGILPLQFAENQNAESLGLDGTERYTIEGITFSDGVPESELVHVVAHKSDGSDVHFDALVRIDTATEGRYYENGGILQYVLRGLI